MATLIQVIQMATPFATFALGYATKTYGDRRERRRLVVSELVSLALEWYEQVRMLVEEFQFGSDEEKKARREFEYLTGRTILPRYVASLLRVGKRFGKKSEIYREAITFLFALTTGEKSSDDELDFDSINYRMDRRPSDFANKNPTKERTELLRSGLSHRTYASIGS